MNLQHKEEVKVESDSQKSLDSLLRNALGIPTNTRPEVPETVVDLLIAEALSEIRPERA